MPPKIKEVAEKWHIERGVSPTLILTIAGWAYVGGRMVWTVGDALEELAAVKIEITSIRAYDGRMIRLEEQLKAQNDLLRRIDRQTSRNTKPEDQ